MLPSRDPSAFTQESPVAAFHMFLMLRKDHSADPMSTGRQFELSKQFIKQPERQNISARKNSQKQSFSDRQELGNLMDVPQGIHCPLLAAISTITPLAPCQTSLCSLTLQGKVMGKKVMGQHKAQWPWHAGTCASVCGDKDFGIRTSSGDQCPTLAPVSPGTSHLSQDNGGALSASPILSSCHQGWTRQGQDPFFMMLTVFQRAQTNRVWCRPAQSLLLPPSMCLTASRGWASPALAIPSLRMQHLEVAACKNTDHSPFSTMKPRPELIILLCSGS